MSFKVGRTCLYPASEFREASAVLTSDKPLAGVPELMFKGSPRFQVSSNDLAYCLLLNVEE